MIFDKHVRSDGFTLVELLISLAIMATLMAAVAMAIDASLSNYSENDKLAQMTQTARVVLARIANEIRSADDVGGSSTRLLIATPADVAGPDYVEYELSSGQLYYRTSENGSTTSYLLLASNDEVTISSFQVLRQTGTDSKGEFCTKTATVRMTLSCGDRNMDMSISASPRRNQSY